MKSEKIIPIIFIFAVIIISGCAQQNNNQNNNIQDSNNQDNNIQDNQPQLLKGVSLSPRSFISEDFKDFFVRARQAGEVVTWSGDWNELANTENSGPIVVTELSSQYNYTPVIIVQFFTQSNGQLLRQLNDANIEIYNTSAVDFAKKYKPEYIGFGIEVNILYEKSPSDFNNFDALYSQIYDNVKAVSPNTKIFTVFQLEKMKGLNGGLFGGTNNGSTEWQMLDRFPKSDVIAFTTYPGLIYKSPDQIPNDYYSEISLHTTKPLIFTEIGWHSTDNIAGWESSEQEQADFIAKFFALTQDMKKEMVIWSFMYDQNTVQPFSSMGLIKSNNEQKLAWTAWVNA